MLRSVDAVGLHSPHPHLVVVSATSVWRVTLYASESSEIIVYNYEDFGGPRVRRR
jgi:hypothetical protein